MDSLSTYTDHGLLESAIVTTASQQLVNFESLKEKFSLLYEEAIQKYSQDSLKFSQNLLEIENTLICIQQTPDLSETRKITILQLEEKYDELYRMIPNGKSVLLRRDLMKLQELFTLPTNTTYSCDQGEFYEPQVTFSQINSYFQEFKNTWGYSGISTKRKTNYFYNTTFQDRIFTTITFIKPKNHSIINVLNSLGGFFSPFFKLPSYKSPLKNIKKMTEEEREESIELIEVDKNGIHEAEDPEAIHLSQLIENKIEEWGFTDYKIGLVLRDYQDLNQNDRLQSFGSYLFLFHKKIEKKWDNT